MEGPAFPSAEAIRSRKTVRDQATKATPSGNEPGVTSTACNQFPKSKRLLKHADFQRVYQQGRRQFTGNMTVFFLRRGAADEARLGREPRVGFTVGKVVGASVERNRIRRRMREAVRTSWQVLDGPVDVVFNPRRSVLSQPYQDLVSEVTRGLRLAVQRARMAEAGQQQNRNDRPKVKPKLERQP